MGKKEEKDNSSITIDNQLVEWRKKFDKDIPERVGLAFYTNEKGETEVEVYFADENMWMSRETMGLLFDVDPRTISDHITNIYKSAELEEDPTRRKIRRVQTEGNRQVAREIDFYNLDLVISVGYRVSSFKATQFRKFATRVLHDYIQKGFVINDDRFNLLVNNGGISLFLRQSKPESSFQMKRILAETNFFTLESHECHESKTRNRRDLAGHMSDTEGVPVVCPDSRFPFRILSVIIVTFCIVNYQ